MRDWEVGRNANNASVFFPARERAKVFGVVGDKYTFLLYRQLVDLRIGKAAVFEIGDNMFDIKLTIEEEKGCSRGHVFIEQQFMFIKPFRHEVWW